MARKAHQAAKMIDESGAPDAFWKNFDLHLYGTIGTSPLLKLAEEIIRVGQNFSQGEIRQGLGRPKFRELCNRVMEMILAPDTKALNELKRVLDALRSTPGQAVDRPRMLLSFHYERLRLLNGKKPTFRELRHEVQKYAVFSKFDDRHIRRLCQGLDLAAGLKGRPAAKTSVQTGRDESENRARISRTIPVDD